MKKGLHGSIFLLLTMLLLQVNNFAQCNVNFESSPLGTFPGMTGLKNAVDFNGDGLTDFSGTSANVLTVLPRNAAGGFDTPLNFDLTSPLGGAIYLHFWGDFNNDGKLDVVATYETQSPSGIIWLNDGSGNFYFGNYVPLGSIENINNVADFNGDGVADLVTIDFNRPIGTDESSWYVYMSNGTASYAPRQLLHASNGNAFTGDFNADGKIDIALFHITNKADKRGLRIFSNNGNGTFKDNGETKLSNLNAYFAADLTGDGKTDIFGETSTGGIQPTLMKTESLSKSSQTVYSSIYTNNRRYYIGDFNGDGRRDLLNTGISFSGTGAVGGFNLFAGQSNGTLTNTAGTFNFNDYGDARVMAFANDFDADGKTDLVRLTSDSTLGTTTIDFIKTVCR